MHTTNTTADVRLASMAAKLLGLVMQHAHTSSDPAEAVHAAALHDAGRLYPRLTVTSPHGGGAVRLELVLCDPENDEPVVRMFMGEAMAEVAACH